MNIASADLVSVGGAGLGVGVSGLLSLTMSVLLSPDPPNLFTSSFSSPPVPSYQLRVLVDGVDIYGSSSLWERLNGGGRNWSSLLH